MSNSAEAEGHEGASTVLAVETEATVKVEAVVLGTMPEVSSSELSSSETQSMPSQQPRVEPEGSTTRSV